MSRSQQFITTTTSSQHMQVHQSFERDDRVSQAITEFLKMSEQGESVDLDALLAKYADVADELAACIETFDFMRNVAPQLTEQHVGEDRCSSPSILPLANLGDFRLVREIGRGGMGVVYEAVQLSLNRRMALKVLPFAAMLDMQQLNRFKNEARAAATLDHPNIVRVHSVGEERGVHYYAMQLVNGQSIAEFIASRRQPSGRPALESGLHHAQTVDQYSTDQQQSADGLGRSEAEVDTRQVARLSTMPDSNTKEYFREVARIGVKAARALEHAHENGIIHRDIKPGNLLLDTECNLYVTDFGLARMGTDSGMTMTGDLVGTLRYMSPEQTRAQQVVIDHRTDIYSLGATLYELLALRPAFPQQDHQELLLHIAVEDPLRLRRLNLDVPIELETIVSKAMEKSPHDRYESMRDLAQDLEHYLVNKPIQAKPASSLQVVKKWIKRHSTAVRFTVAALLLALCAGFAGVAWQNKTRLELLEESLGLLAEVGMNHLEKEEFQEAEGRLEDAYELALFGLPNSDRVLPNLRYGLGKARYELGKQESAREVLEPLKNTLLAKDENNRQRALGKHLLATLELKMGDYEAALPLLEDVESYLESVDGPDSDFTALVRSDLADALSLAGQHQRAMRVARQALSQVVKQRWEREWVEGCVLTRSAYRALCDAHNRAGKQAELLAELERVHDEIAKESSDWSASWFVGYGLMVADRLPEQHRAYMLDWYLRRIYLTNGRHKVLKPLLGHHIEYFKRSEFNRPAKSQYSGIMFNGNNSFAHLPTVYFNGNSPWTLEVYATPTRESAESMLISCCEAGGIGIGISPEGKWRFLLGDGQNGGETPGATYVVAKSRKPVEYGKRQHIAGVWAGNEIRLYLNGQLQEHLPVNAEAVRRYLIGSTFTLGADPGVGCSVQGSFFSGAIESVRISRSNLFTSNFTPADELTPVESTIVAIDFRNDIDDPTPADGEKSLFGFDQSGFKNHAWIANAVPQEAGKEP